MTPMSRSAQTPSNSSAGSRYSGRAHRAGIDGEHDRVEVEAAQRLEMGPGHLEVVAGDPGEAGVAGVAQAHDPLEGGERRSSSSSDVTAWAW